MTIKKIISTICASVFAFSCFGFNVNADKDDIVSRVYRTSVSGVTMDNKDDSYSVSYTATLEAYSDGKIHIEVKNTADSMHSQHHIIGKYSFNDFYIYPYNERNDKSHEYWSSHNHDCSTTYEYNNDNIVYTLSAYSYYFKYISDLYVREEYLQSTIPFNFFGEDIEIPFGTVPISSNSDELQKVISELKYENEQLSKKNVELNTRMSELELDNEELNSLRVQNYALSSSIVAIENENKRLVSKIESFNKMDFDGDGLLTNADAQMILVYYTDSLVGKTTGKVEDYSEYVKQISG